MNFTHSIGLLALGALLTSTACNQEPPPAPAMRVVESASRRVATNTPPPAPDNTATNTVDAKGDTVTPLDQSQSSEHVKITADIRLGIMKTEGMSMNGQNCKIVTDSTGMVTLRGVVDSQAERASIEAIAKQIAGPAKVDNQLEVQPI